MVVLAQVGWLEMKKESLLGVKVFTGVPNVEMAEALRIPYQMSPAPMNCPVQQLQVHQQHLNDLQLPVLFEENCTRVPCRPQLEEVPPKHTFVGHQKLHEAFVEAVCFGTM